MLPHNLERRMVAGLRNAKIHRYGQVYRAEMHEFAQNHPELFHTYRLAIYLSRLVLNPIRICSGPCPYSFPY